MSDTEIRPTRVVPFSVVSFRIPKDVRRRVKICAALDDISVSDWAVRALDKASLQQMSNEIESAF